MQGHIYPLFSLGCAETQFNFHSNVTVKISGIEDLCSEVSFYICALAF